MQRNCRHIYGNSIEIAGISMENQWKEKTRNVRDEEREREREGESTYGGERRPRTGPDGYIERDELDVENGCSPEAGEESGDVPSRVGLAFHFGLLCDISVC